MKRFACGDVVPGCSATFTPASEHGLHEVTPELQATVRSLISAA